MGECGKDGYVGLVWNKENEKDMCHGMQDGDENGGGNFGIIKNVYHRNRGMT